MSGGANGRVNRRMRINKRTRRTGENRVAEREREREKEKEKKRNAFADGQK